MGKDSSPPPAVDNRGAAIATAQGNLDAARLATKANRVNQYTPYGNLIYSHSGDDQDAGWSQNIELSPVGQQLLDYGNKSAIGLGQQQGNALNRVNDSLSTPFNANSAQAATDQAYKNIASRLDPQWDNRQVQTETQLTNQGLRPGSEAWDNAMRDFNTGRNDAYTQANTTAMQFAPQAMQLELAGRNQPLNELNALRTGSQVTTPQFGSVPQQQTTAGPNFSGAASADQQYNTGLFNAQQGSNNATTSGLFAVGSAALMAF